MFDDLDNFTEMQAAFMEAFYEATEATVDKSYRLWEGVVAFDITNSASDHGVELGPDELYLADFESGDTGKGYGGEALDWLFELADQFSISIKLHSDAKDSKIIDQRNLDGLYMRRGCQPIGDNGFMQRVPR